MSVILKASSRSLLFCGAFRCVEGSYQHFEWTEISDIVIISMLSLQIPDCPVST